jgi:nucleoside-diphosphate-sugar epimerase
MLAGAGHRVLGLRRTVAGMPEAIEGIAADLLAPHTLQSLPAGIDHVVYAAAADGFSEEAYRDAYILGLANLLGALRGRTAARLLFCSSTGVYAQVDQGWVDEDSATEPTAFSGQALLQGEAIAARWGREHGAAACSVRFGGIYGPGRTRLVEQVRTAAACDPTPRWTNRIHRDDCAGVLAHLLMLPAPHARYVAVDCEPATQCEVMDWLADTLALPRPPRRAGGARGRGGNKRCSNRRLLASGYRFRFPTFREGYADVLAAA